jgi:opacity protein-like surface antigen
MKVKIIISCFFFLLAIYVKPIFSKIVFTGYSDVIFKYETITRKNLNPATLSFQTKRETNSTFYMNRVGLFATTNVTEDLLFKTDITFKRIGGIVDKLALQYAHIDYKLNDCVFSIGKITIPFNYYNQNKFYPFNRKEITLPLLYQTIGLPLSDLGVNCNYSFLIRDEFPISIDLFIVNGAGNNREKSDTVFLDFDNPLVEETNYHYEDNNTKKAIGTKIGMSVSDYISFGLSGYFNKWDPEGEKNSNLFGSFFILKKDAFSILAEYSFVDLEGDAGYGSVIGNSENDYLIKSYSSYLDYDFYLKNGKKIGLFINYDFIEGGKSDKKLEVWQYCCGLKYNLKSNFYLKTEYAYYKAKIKNANILFHKYVSDSFNLAAGLTF